MEYSTEQMRPVWLDPEMAAALDRMMDQNPNHKTFDDAIRYILKDWLRVHGHLPISYELPNRPT